jgi:hypothetical protein
MTGSWIKLLMKMLRVTTMLKLESYSLMFLGNVKRHVTNLISVYTPTSSKMYFDISYPPSLDSHTT